jgi:hypothetical protein
MEDSVRVSHLVRELVHRHACMQQEALNALGRSQAPVYIVLRKASKRAPVGLLEAGHRG